MGFFIELKRQSAEGYVETKIPSHFWVLYAIAGFALVCMWASANELLVQMWQQGDAVDAVLVGGLGSFILLYVGVGFKLVGVRKQVDWTDEAIFFGYYLFSKSIWKKRIRRERIADVILMNQRKTPNLAVSEHDDTQYYFRGHWRLQLKLKTGNTITLDKHTEKGGLIPMYRDLRRWLNMTD